MGASTAGVRGTPTVRTRAARIAAWLAGLALALFVLDELGVPISSWIHQLFEEVRAVPAGAVVGGVILDTLQTTFAALSWLTILRAAFPAAGVPFRPILAAYAVSAGLNAFLPGNVGTLVMLVMFVSLIAEATFAAVLSGFVVQKIPFTAFTFATYLYLFASVQSSFSLELGLLSEHPVAGSAIILGGILLVVLAVRVLWRRVTGLRNELKTGGAVLGQPRRFVVGVVLPALASFVARLGIVAVFLAAYSIPVTLHSVTAVTASNSISKSLSPTPGGAGVTQVLNVAVLEGMTSKSNATAYSVAQQLIVSAWDVLFATALVVWVFGWSGGKELVAQSRSTAEAKRHELQGRRRARPNYRQRH